jgi:hypothetical protein
MTPVTAPSHPLSGIPKLVKAFSRRLQVQERLTNEIADILMRKVGPLGVGGGDGSPPYVHGNAGRGKHR